MKERTEENKVKEVGLKGIYGASRCMSPLEGQENIFLVRVGIWVKN